MPVVSIIIPCFGADKYIEKCLEAIAKQTFRDYELILVNDCTQDNTMVKAKPFIRERKINAIIIENNVNQGPSLSRKKGIDASNSEYVTFCDSDDWFEPNFLELMVNASHGYENDIIFCNFKSVYSNGRVVKHDVVSPIMDLEKKQLVGRAFDSLCCMMIRKNIISSVIFPDIRNGEDMAIIPAIVASGNSFGFVDEFIYNYNYHEGSLSKTFTSTMIDSLKKSFSYIRDTIGNDYPVETEFLGIRNLLYGGLLNLFKETYNIGKADGILSEFEAVYPNWDSNELFKTLPCYKKVYLKAARKRMFFLCWMMSIIHKTISK